MAANVNLEMVRGDTRVWSMTIKTRDGNPFDLTGYTVKMTAKRAVTDADGSAVFQKTSPAGGITINSPTAGTITVTLSPSDTSGLPAYTIRLVYDLQVTNGTDTRTALLGYLLIKPDVTITTP